jgi:hypothetical protein
MMRFNINSKNSEDNKEIELFINEILEIYKKYNFSISHEDKFGSFIIEKFDVDNCKWLEQAYIKL